MVPTASLPNPAEPGMVAFGPAIGAFFGGTIARRMGYPADKSIQWTVEGSYYGTGATLCIYFVVNAISILVR